MHRGQQQTFQFLIFYPHKRYIHIVEGNVVIQCLLRNVTQTTISLSVGCCQEQPSPFTKAVTKNSERMQSTSVLFSKLVLILCHIPFNEIENYLNDGLIIISSAGASPPTNVTAVQEDPNVVLVTWNPSSDAQAYRIEYQCRAGTTGVVGTTEGFSQRLEGFQNGDTCNISISATSDHFPSDSVWVTVGLGKLSLNKMDCLILF